MRGLLQVVGSYTLYATCAGTHVVGSPFHIDVLSSGVSTEASEVYVMEQGVGHWEPQTPSTTVTIRAGTMAQFGVELKDDCGACR